VVIKMKCNFKEEGSGMLLVGGSYCQLTGKKCNGEDKCILFKIHRKIKT